MKSRQIQLAIDDQKALALIHENLELCAWNRTLTKKLISKFSPLMGSSVAIIPHWFDLSRIKFYTHGLEPPDRASYARGDSPMDELVDFVAAYLQSNTHSVVVCDNSEIAMKSLEIWTWSVPPRYSRYRNSDVYYILDPVATNRETIDAALSDSLRGKWGIAVCSSCTDLPDSESVDGLFQDEVVANTKHLLMPAFDGDGYLIWTPTA